VSPSEIFLNGQSKNNQKSRCPEPSCGIIRAYKIILRFSRQATDQSISNPCSDVKELAGTLCGKLLGLVDWRGYRIA
jgi:hypothetical protein